MNLKNLFVKLSLLVVFLVAFSANTFAATYYVSATNGNDLVFPGSQAQPFQTISKALTTSSDGDVIVIFTDTYNESGAQLNINKAVTFQVMQTPNTTATVVLITNGIQINSTTTTKTVVFQSGVYSFNLGITPNALLLTAGTMDNSGATVALGSGATVTRAAGSLTSALSTTNVNVTYNSAVDITAGPELPANLGTGSLTINVTAAGKILTVGSSIQISTGQIVTAGTNLGNATFNGTVTVSTDTPAGSPVSHVGTGTLTFTNPVVFTAPGPGSVSALVSNSAAGTVALLGGITPTLFKVGLANTAAGKIQIGAGTYAGIVNNDFGGTIELLASATFSNNVSNNAAGSVIKLNSNQLTLSFAGGILTNTGHIISTTNATVGTGLLLVSGSITAAGGGELPNVTITGKLTLADNTQLYGNFTLNSATAGGFTDGGNNLSVAGNFLRSDNTAGNYAATGSLTFNGPSNQAFNPGASLTLNRVIINNVTAAPNNVVLMAASVAVKGDFTITAGKLDLSNYNITMTTTGTTFNNGAGGGYYTSTGNGYLIMQGIAQNLAGAGVYSNLLINVGTGNSVNITAATLKFSGILVLYSGSLSTNANTLQLTSDYLTIPTIRVKVDGIGQLNTSGGGQVTVATGVVYNLEYYGTAVNYDATNVPVWGGEWIKASINNLWINTGGTTIVFTPNVASNIAGTLTINSAQTMQTVLAANVIYTLSGANQAHKIFGKIALAAGGAKIILNETGSGSSITGSTVTADAATILDLTVAVGAAGTFTSTNLKSIANLTNTTGTSTVMMNTTAAVITGNLTLTAGSLTLTMGSVAAQQNILGTSTLTAGTLTLGSNISVAGQTTQAKGNLALSSFNYTQLGSAATPDYNRTDIGTITGTGALVLDATAAALDITPFTAPASTSLTVPNLVLIANPNGIVLNGALTVSNSLTHTSGNVNYSNITLAGPTYTYVAPVAPDLGLIAGTFTVTNTASTLTFGASVAIPTFIINAPAGTVTIASSSATAARTITASTAFKLTDGTLALGNNTLAITGTFTRVAGAITEAAATSALPNGNLVFNNPALDFVTGAGFSVDNLEIQSNATNITDNKAYTVNLNLLLTAGTLTNDEKLTIGNGALVTVNAGFLTSTVAANFPSYGGTYSVIYITGGAYAAGDEIPGTATVLNNLTVNNAAAVVTLTNGGQVNGKFYEKNGNFTIPATKTLTLIAGGTWDIGLGTLTITGTFSRSTYNLIYSDGFTGTTSIVEFPVLTPSILSLQVIDDNTSIILNNSKTVNGSVTINGNAATSINFGGFALSAMRDVTVATGGFKNNAGTGTLTFAGTVAQTFSIPAALTFPLVSSTAGAVLEINNAAGVTLANGNLTMLDPTHFSSTTSVLKLTSGVFTTGLNSIKLWQYYATGAPLQGYTRSSGYVNGNIIKLLDATAQYYGGTLANAATALTRVEFPVGSATNYRPMAYQFNTLPTSNFNLTVNEVDSNPGGTNGFPITSGAIQLANYPPFYWLVTSDLTLQPQVTYDIEAEANGYDPSNYTEGIQNVRFLRRFAPVATISNPWVLQGSSSGTAIYDNSTVGTGITSHAKVIVRSAEGAISTQGAIFTFSQAAKAPAIQTALASVTVPEGVQLNIVWKDSSQNLGGTATFNTPPVWTATAPAVVPTNTTFNAATGTLTWTPNYVQSGVYTVTVTSVDGSLSKTNTVTITVTNSDQAPSFDATANPGALTNPTATIAVTLIPKALVLTYKAIDPDGDAITYSITADKAVSALPAITGGAFSWTPVNADIALSPVTFTIKASSGTPVIFGTTSTVVTITSGVIKGDVDGDGTPTALDAGLILQEVVGLIPPFTGLTAVAADVNGDGQVGALDAAWILYYVANQGQWPSSGKTVATAGNVSFGKFIADNEVMRLPISLQNTAGVRSFSAEVTLGTNVLFKTVKTSLPDGWQIASKVENGKLKIAMAGINPLVDGDLAVIELSLKNKESVVSLQGSVKMNDELDATMKPVELREIPTKFNLSQNYPNPFNPTTNINYAIPQDANVNLTVYNVLGQAVKTIVNVQQKAGYYSVRWDGSNETGSKVSSGMYIYRITAGNYTHSIKMNLIK